MPLIDLRYPEGSLDEDRLARLAERLGAAARAAEGLPETDAARAISVVNCESLRHVFVGGRKAEAPRFLVVIHAFAEAMDAAARRTLAAEVVAAFRAECPACVAEGGRNVWCVINALPPGSFAAGGHLVGLAQVRAMVGAPAA